MTNNLFNNFMIDDGCYEDFYDKKHLLINFLKQLDIHPDDYVKNHMFGSDKSQKIRDLIVPYVARLT